MGQGGYIFAEWDSIQKEFPQFKQAFIDLERESINKCNVEWAKPCGYLTPKAGEYGRTSIIPALFRGFDTNVMAHWRQWITTMGQQTIIYGAGTGNILPEQCKVAWIGLAFPNKEQNITEIKWQLGDRKYGRINLEEMKSYNKPAIIFEEGFIIDEEQAFDLYAYVEGEIPVDHQGRTGIYQRVVMLGACYYKIVDKMLGNCGAAVPVT